MTYLRRIRAPQVVVTLLLGCLALLFALPIVWWAVFAVQSRAGVTSKPLLDTWVPDSFVFFDNLAHAFALHPFGRFFLNSVIVTSSITVAEILLASLAAFAFTFYRFAGRDLLFKMVIACLIIPQIMLIIPLFEMVTAFDQANTYTALTVPFLVSPFGVFLMRQFMLSIPSEYVEAARVEGASELRIFVTIVLPLARNALLALAIFTFLLQWDSLLWPLVATSRQEFYTLAVGVSLLQTSVIVPYNAIYAVTLLFSLPVLLFYVVLQRQFISGLSLTGLKG